MTSSLALVLPGALPYDSVKGLGIRARQSTAFRHDRQTPQPLPQNPSPASFLLSSLKEIFFFNALFLQRDVCALVEGASSRNPASAANVSLERLRPPSSPSPTSHGTQ